MSGEQPHAGSEVLEYTLDRCKLLAEKVSSANEMPYGCAKFPAAMKEAEKPAKIARSLTSHAGMQGALAAKKNKAAVGKVMHKFNVGLLIQDVLQSRSKILFG